MLKHLIIFLLTKFENQSTSAFMYTSLYVRYLYLIYFSFRYIVRHSLYLKVVFLIFTNLPWKLFVRWSIFGAKNNVLPYNNYEKWIEVIEVKKKTKTLNIPLKKTPLISIIMPVYNPPVNFLKEAILSVIQQSYENWELCIVDDNSTKEEVVQCLNHFSKKNDKIKVKFRSSNGNISTASNDALEMATGNYIAFLDHDDSLEPNALARMIEAINLKPNAKLFYSDEDKLDEKGKRCQPHFKPDWNYELFLGYNYLCHFVLVEKNAIKGTGGFREGFEGAQDYDLLIRIIENLANEEIIHLPEILYHWRILPGSTSLNIGEKSNVIERTELLLNEHFLRKGIKGKFRFHPTLKIFQPSYSLENCNSLVSIIIPTRNAKELVHDCITSILELTTYSNFEIVLVDNQSDEHESIQYFESLKSNPQIKVLNYNHPFNFSSINNFAVKHCSGEYVVLLNNDTKVISPNWLETLLSIGIQKGIGAVGAKLIYADQRVQHGGILIGRGGVAGHLFQFLDRLSPGYFNRAQMLQTLSAVTAACLLVSKDNYLRVSGMNEENLSVAFNDVDFCLKLNTFGLRNVWSPDVLLFHFESISRGKEDNPIKQARFNKEVDYMFKTWKTNHIVDKYYNPNLNLSRGDFSLNWIT